MRIAAASQVAFGRRPFEQGPGAAYSYAAMSFDALQILAACDPLPFGLALRERPLPLDP